MSPDQSLNVDQIYRFRKHYDGALGKIVVGTRVKITSVIYNRKWRPFKAWVVFLNKDGSTKKNRHSIVVGNHILENYTTHVNPTWLPEWFDEIPSGSERDHWNRMPHKY